jgi:lipopolysaccharide transport system ATP-binding protein
MSNTAIQIENVSKKYRLGVINNGTLWQDIQSYFARKFGKEDPHSRIGDDRYLADKDHFWALKDVSLDIKQGDRVGIIGKNGAGKSTLLKILSRITIPTEGTIKIKGKIASLLEVGTGFHGELTGRENIYLNGAILGMKKRRISEKMDSIIAFSGIEYHIDTPVKRYSSGMFVRLAFAVAAHLDSDILIADEVLAVGDFDFQNKALGKMQELSTGEGRTVLFVSHNMEAVQKLCNQGVILEKGRIIKTSNDVPKLVLDYKNEKINQLRSLAWENSGNIYNEYFTPLCLQLVDENNKKVEGGISADKDYKIKLTFEVQKLSTNLNVYLVFSIYGGIILFVTSPFDYISNYNVHIGKNIIYCSIPKYLLNINDYFISLGSYSNKHTIINNPYLDATDPSKIMMKISVTSKSSKNLFEPDKAALSPELIWTEEE